MQYELKREFVRRYDFAARNLKE